MDQIWARYLEGDNISTKIGSGRDRDRGGLPDFLKNRDQDRGGLPDFLTNRDMSGCPIPSFPRFFPAILGQKKIRKNRGKSG